MENWRIKEKQNRQKFEHNLPGATVSRASKAPGARARNSQENRPLSHTQPKNIILDPLNKVLTNQIKVLRHPQWYQ